MSPSSSLISDDAGLTRSSTSANSLGKARQVRLVRRDVVDVGRDLPEGLNRPVDPPARGPVRLLLVEEEVLEGADDTLRLDAADGEVGADRGKVRVGGEACSRALTCMSCRRYERCGNNGLGAPSQFLPPRGLQRTSQRWARGGAERVSALTIDRGDLQ